MAKYEVLLHGMRVTKEMSVSRLCYFGESDLVASQVSGTCDASDLTMIAYRRAVDKIEGSFLGHSVEWIDRHTNEDADVLTQLMSARQPPPPDVFLDVLDRPSVLPLTEIELGAPLAPDSTLIVVATPTTDWTKPYVDYLEHNVLLEDEAQARMIQRRCKAFILINGELHKRSVSGAFQRCVSPEEGRKILYNNHAGDCGHHGVARSLVTKALCHGFYWLTANADATDIVQRCTGCQKYANQTHVPR
jgi:hypothetical protein